MRKSHMVLAAVSVAVLIGVGAGVAIAEGGSGTTPPSAGGVSPDALELAAALSLDKVPESLQPLAAAWRERGVEILALTADEKDPARVTVKVPARILTGPDSIPVAAELQRRPALLRASGVTVTWLDIYMVADDGSENLYTGFLVDDLLPSPDWRPDASSITDASAAAAVRSLVDDAAQATATLNVSTKFSVSQDGRTVAVTAIVGPGGSATQGAFVDAVHGAVFDSNRHQETAVALLKIDVVDTSGRLLVREFDDFAVANGGVRSWWVAEDFREMEGYKPESY